MYTLQTRDIQAAHFNSRPSARGDVEESNIAAPIFDFNSRPSARGDTRSRASSCTCEDFNSRPSARGDKVRIC